MSEPDAPSSSNRRVATVLFTDIVGSTQRLAELGDAQWHGLLQRHNEIVRAAIERHGGREVSTAGDSFLVVFENPARAIECAVEVAEAVSQEGIQIRAGIHTGEIVETATDIRGIGVHIGARISAKAGAGEVLVSRMVRDLARGSDHEFEPRGTFVLKGVPGQWQLYAVAGTARRGSPLREVRVWVDRHRRLAVASLVVTTLALGAVAVSVVIRGSEPRFSPERLLAAEAPAAIAVLPFTVRGAGTEIWREGMVDILSTGLDGVAGLRTISSRTLLARWGQEVVDDEAADITTALEVAWGTGARYALAGSVVAVGPDMRLIAEAYDIDTGARLGQAQVEGSPDDVLSLCDRLGVEMLAIILQGEEELGSIELASLISDSTDAVVAYLEGEVHLRHYQMPEAADDYRRAVEADSSFALAHSRLGYMYSWLDRDRKLRDHHMGRAMELVDRLPPRQALKIRATHELTRRTLDALEPLRQGVRQHPDDPELWFLLGETLLHVRSSFATTEEIEQALHRAFELDPRHALYLEHPVLFAWSVHADSALAAKRLAVFEQVAPPDYWGVVDGRLALDLAFGDSASREEALARVLETPDDTPWGHLLHPRFADLLTEILREAEKRTGAWGGFLVPIYAYDQGKLSEALPYLDSPFYGRGPDAKAWSCYKLLDSEFRPAMPEETVEECEAALDPGVLEREGPEGWSASNGSAVFHIGAFAADRGRWPVYNRAEEEFERRAKVAFEAGDSVSGLRLEGHLKALQGYARWQQGQPEVALAFLEDPQAVRGYDVAMVWLGRLYEESGRLRDAERVYRAEETSPLFQRRLGKIYEELEEWDKALESYEFFVTYWNDADPELQPMVEDAREAILRLEGLRRE